jgi:hypothetical protein
MNHDNGLLGPVFGQILRALVSDIEFDSRGIARNTMFFEDDAIWPGAVCSGERIVLHAEVHEYPPLSRAM